MSRVHALFLVLLAFLGACSMRSAIDAFSSPEDRAFAQNFIDRLRSGDTKSLEVSFEPQVWRESASQLGQARRLFPSGRGTTELIGFQFSTNMTNGATRRTKDYTLVTHDDAHWTTTVLRTQSEGNGPQRIIGWNVNGGSEMPAAYRQFQTMDNMARGFWIGGLVVIVFIVGLVIFLIRRSRRRRRDPLMGQGGGTS